MTAPILSHFQAAPLLKRRDSLPAAAELSLDLGLSTVAVELDESGLHLPAGLHLNWDDLADIAANENNCFAITAAGLEKVITFSEHTSRVYSLFPTRGAPTMLLSGVPMHRIKATTPEKDTKAKIKAAAPLYGRVLDTATGLGYTAIGAAEKAHQVITIEFDPAVLEICRYNPWSQALFSRENIEQRIGDSYDVVADMADGFIDIVIHDPPAMALAGHLYGSDFYAELWRVLRPGGKLFHYIGDPGSKSGGNITRGAIRRLNEVGFGRVVRRPQAFGVVAFKEKR